MADISDARQALAQIIAGFIYPGGVPSGTVPPAPSVGAPVRIYAGSPEREALDADLAAGIVNITVDSGQDGRNTTRFPPLDRVISVEPASLAWTVAGIGATLSGTIASPQNAGLLVDGKAYLHAVQQTDTLASITAALAALIAADQPATADDVTVMVPNSYRIVGRIGTVGRTLREVGREIVTMHISIWAPSPTLREAAVATFEPNLRDLRRFSLPDGSIAQIWAERSNDEDRLEKAVLYRRNALYKLEYASTIAGTVAQILTFTENVAVGTAPATALIA